MFDGDPVRVFFPDRNYVGRIIHTETNSIGLMLDVEGQSKMFIPWHNIHRVEAA